MDDNERFGEIRSIFAQAPNNAWEAELQWMGYSQYCFADTQGHIASYIRDRLDHIDQSLLLGDRRKPLWGWTHLLYLYLPYSEHLFDHCPPVPGRLDRERHAHAMCLAERFLQATIVGACYLGWRQRSRVPAYPRPYFFRVLLPGWESGFGVDLQQLLTSMDGVERAGVPPLQVDNHYHQFLQRAYRVAQRYQVNLRQFEIGEYFNRLCADLGMLLCLIGIDPLRIEALYSDIFDLAWEVVLRYADPPSVFKTLYYAHDSTEIVPELTNPAHGRYPREQIIAPRSYQRAMWGYAVDPQGIQARLERTLDNLAGSDLFVEMMI